MLRFFIVLILIPCTLFAQYSPKEIDSLMTTEYYRLREGRNLQQAIEQSKKVITASQKINYKKGEIYGYARLGNALCNLGKYKESLEALNQATQLIEEEKFEDHYIRSSIYIGIGRCYSITTVSHQNAITQYEKAVFHAEKIPNQHDKEMQLSIIYSNIYAAYHSIRNEDKAVQYLWKILNFKEYSHALIGLAKYHNDHTEDADSAKIYLERAQKTTIENYAKPSLYNQWGSYYFNKNEYDKAIAFYKKAEVSAKEIGNPFELEYAFYELYNIYEEKGVMDQALIYYQKRTALNDSLNFLHPNNADVMIKDIAIKKEKVTKDELSQTQKIFIGSGILALLVLSFFIIKNYRNQREKKKALDLIEEKEEENQELKQKVNDSFEEITLLAKSNSPEFLTRFQEIYPELTEKLKKIYPEISSEDLRFCALLKLNFSTKDIAEYTFVTVRSVQTRKSRLRKKFDIPSDVDIYLWINEL